MRFVVPVLLIQLAVPSAASAAGSVLPPPVSSGGPAALVSAGPEARRALQTPALPVEESEEEEDEAEKPPVTYDVPIIVNEKVEDWLEFFQITYREKFTLWLDRSRRYLPMMRQTFRDAGLPEDLVYVALIESGFNPNAYSRSKAVGPWQFMRGTAKKYGLKMDAWVDERRDPIKSTGAAARYLKDLYTMFADWPLAMASYNAGEGRIQRVITRAKSNDIWQITASSRYLKPETRHYVPKFMAATIIAKNPEQYGFSLKEDNPMQYDTVEISGPTDLRFIAKASGSTYDTLKDLNPELRRGMTPANVRTYPLRLPVGARAVYVENISKVPDEKRLLWKRYRVRQGDTLQRIGRRYQTTPNILRDINRLDTDQPLVVGESLFIPLASQPIVVTEREPGERQQIVYIVKRGETLTAIARKYSVGLDDIRRWNRLEDADIIQHRQRLLLFVASNPS